MTKSHLSLVGEACIHSFDYGIEWEARMHAILGIGRLLHMIAIATAEQPPGNEDSAIKYIP